MSKLRPILFSTAMVQAILEGRKTQTRRVLKPQPGDHPNDDGYMSTVLERCPYGQPGDILWVRETWAPALGDICYKADYSEATLNDPENQGLWKPSIHMPFAAARIFLRVKSVRVEPLQAISYDDAESWNDNPWEWVVEFERVTKEEAGV